MGGGLGGLEAAPLVDGHVHQHRPLLHGAQHLAGHQARCLGTGDQDGSHHHVRLLDQFADCRRAGHQGEAVGRHHVAQVAQTVQVHVQQVHLGSQAAGHLGRIDPYHAAADHHHRARVHARHTAQQHTVAALGHLQVLGSLLDGHAPGHFAHGGQQRQAAVGLLDRLVGDANGLAFNQRVGLGQVRGQMQVGEHDLAFTDHVVLGRQGLFDMHDHVGRIEDLFGDVDHLGPGIDVGLIGKAAAGPCGFFHQHRVPVVNHHLHAGRGHAHAVLFRLDLFQYSDNHFVLPCSCLVIKSSQWLF